MSQEPRPEWTQIHLRPAGEQSDLDGAALEDALRVLVDAGVLQVWRDPSGGLHLLPQPSQARALVERVTPARHRRSRPNQKPNQINFARRLWRQLSPDEASRHPMLNVGEDGLPSWAELLRLGQLEAWTDDAGFLGLRWNLGEPSRLPANLIVHQLTDAALDARLPPLRESGLKGPEVTHRPSGSGFQCPRPQGHGLPRGGGRKESEPKRRDAT